MLNVFRRNPAARITRPLRTILGLEAFEQRAQPSDIGPGGFGGDGQIAPENNPPEIVDFTVTRQGPGTYLITGRVIDENPGGLTITLSGSTSCADQTTTTLSNGTFSIVVVLQLNGTDTGFITATTVDDHNQISNEPSYFVTPN